MRRQLVPALMMTIALTILTGLAYPLVVTGVAQGVFNSRANGSLVKVNGKVVGSSLLGQNFTHSEVLPAPAFGGRRRLRRPLVVGVEPRAFEPRPVEDHQGPCGRVPSSEWNGRKRAGPGRRGDRLGLGARPRHLDRQRPPAGRPGRRVRSLPLATVLAAVGRHTENRQWGFLGERVVNVLELNLDLDRLSAASK